MGHARTLLTSICPAILVISFSAQAAPEEMRIPEAELVWPGGRLGFLAEWHLITGKNESLPLGWPKTLGDICKPSRKLPDSAGSAEPILDALRETCQELSGEFPILATVDFGTYPRKSFAPVNRIFEKFNSGWASVRIDPELGREWVDLPPTLKLELQYAVSEHSFLYFRMGLRRDLVAWHQDDIGLNAPFSGQEVDLNEPTLGYFHAENEHFSLTVGRFVVHWSPTPDFGLALSRSVPYHNAAEFVLKTPLLRYKFLVSSLNSWLEGTPIGDSASENYPVGSEAYLQRHYKGTGQAGNAHNRVYAENIKTLFAHRIEADVGPFSAGLTEMQIIGGKVPDLRDGNPFAFFHNDFKDGYSNIGLSMDAIVRLPFGISVAGETFLDDVQYSETEGSNVTPSLLGLMGHIRHGFSVKGWLIAQHLYLIRTDPFLYGYPQPLNTMYSRQILSSNMKEDENRIVDRYVVDYPLGYQRGGDAFDLWYKVDAMLGRSWFLNFNAGVLAHGEVDFSKPYADYYSSGHDAPTGIPEKEIRIILDCDYRWQHGISIHGGVAWQRVEDHGHLAGAELGGFRVSAGTAWALP